METNEAKTNTANKRAPSLANYGQRQFELMANVGHPTLDDQALWAKHVADTALGQTAIDAVTIADVSEWLREVTPQTFGAYPHKILIVRMLGLIDSTLQRAAREFELPDNVATGLCVPGTPVCARCIDLALEVEELRAKLAAMGGSFT